MRARASARARVRVRARVRLRSEGEMECSCLVGLCAHEASAAATQHLSQHRDDGRGFAGPGRTWGEGEGVRIWDLMSEWINE